MKNINAKVAFSYVMFLAIFFFNSGDVKSQPMDRQLLDSSIYARNGIWYNEIIGKYFQRYNILNNLPPLRTDMPLEVLLSYIYGDSLLKYTTDEEYLITNRWLKEKIKNDTIIQLIKYFYITQDFCPYLLEQYKNTPVLQRYKHSVNAINLFITKMLEILAENTPEYYPLSFIQRHEYILRVKIKNTIEEYTQIKSGIPHKYYYVSAYVIDTLKGKEFLTCNCNNVNLNATAPLNYNPIICFTYADASYTHSGHKYPLDPSLLRKGNLYLEDGQELILSISLGNYLLDRNYDYLDSFLSYAIPIYNNQVMDKSHIWSSSDLLDYEDFKAIFFQRRQMLLEGGY